jgi:hypothetical protein
MQTLLVVDTETNNSVAVRVLDEPKAALKLSGTIVGKKQVLPYKGEVQSELTWYEFLLGYFFDFVDDENLVKDWRFSTWFTEELFRLEKEKKVEVQKTLH